MNETEKTPNEKKSDLEHKKRMTKASLMAAIAKIMAMSTYGANVCGPYSDPDVWDGIDEMFPRK